MPGKTNVFSNDELKLVFNNTPINAIGDVVGLVGSAVAGSLFVSLHSADPTDSGTQLSSEVNYIGYTRVSTPRTTAAWTITTSGDLTKASPTVNIQFPTCTGGTSTPTHFGIGSTLTGAGKLMYVGTTSPVGVGVAAVSTGISPQLSTESSIIVY